jgi:hypothetical protein
VSGNAKKAVLGVANLSDNPLHYIMIFITKRHDVPCSVQKSVEIARRLASFRRDAGVPEALRTAAIETGAKGMRKRAEARPVRPLRSEGQGRDQFRHHGQFRRATLAN